MIDHIEDFEYPGEFDGSVNLDEAANLSHNLEISQSLAYAGSEVYATLIGDDDKPLFDVEINEAKQVSAMFMKSDEHGKYNVLTFANEHRAAIGALFVLGVVSVAKLRMASKDIRSRKKQA